MFSAAISTWALILAVGPQLHAGLQLVTEPAPVVTEAAPVIAEAAPEITSEPPATPIILAQATPQPSDPAPSDPRTMDEVEIIPAPVTAPDFETETPEPAETAPTVTNQSNQIPEAEWPSILEKASAALASAKRAQGKFVQQNADGSVSTGRFALSRPGKMRFDYDDPAPILIVSDGTTVAMEDSELETVDRIPLASTPLGLILSNKLDYDGNANILGILRNDDRLGIRVSDATGELDGTLTMVFDRESYDLIGWLSVDGNLQTTVVDLLDVETNGRIDPRLFRLEDAQDEEDER